MRSRRQRQAAHCPIPAGRLASLVDPANRSERGRMMTPVNTLLAKLPSAKKSGNGWLARCPAHEDRRASLSVSEGDDGRALLNCHAGCGAAAILSALGLTLADLFPSKADPSPTRNGKPKAAGRTFATANDAVAELERRHGKRSALWPYHDAHGEPVGVVVRWDGKDND